MASINSFALNVNNTCNVKDFGAIGDGKTLDTIAINKAIEKCAVESGGIVYFPEGTFLSGSIHLKSSITLNISDKATILGAPNDIGVYDQPEANPWDAYQDFGHSHWHNSLIWGENLQNITIMGKGTINGGGMTKEDPLPGGGDKAIALKLCKNILIKDITIVHGGHFAILPTGCDDMVIDSVVIDTNRDGIDVDCCHNVTVKNCIVNSPFDDAIVPKSSYALGYKRLTENIRIENCSVYGYDEGSLISGKKSGSGGCGRIKFGTETNGGFKDVVVKDCYLESCQGLLLEIVDGGIMENFHISNITMKDTLDPIFIRLGNRARGPNNPAVGKIKDIIIEGIKATYYMGDPTNFLRKDFLKHPVIISGIPGHYIGRNIILKNILIDFRGGGTIDEAKIIPIENEAGYPDPQMFGELPAYGFYLRHVNGLILNNIKIGFNEIDMRPALYFDDAKDILINNMTLDKAEGVNNSIVATQIQNIMIKNLKENIRSLTNEAFIGY
jgi:polygalacturonase